MAKQAGMRWDERASSAANAKLRLPLLVREYFAAGRKIMNADSGAKVLHKFRLETKRVRYALELFRPLYSTGLERHLAALRLIQDHLGAISDSEAAKQVICDVCPRATAERRRLEDLLDANAKRRSAALRKYWQETFDKPGEEQRWRLYLSRHAGRTQRTAR